jgi:hypothetical protein
LRALQAALADVAREQARVPIRQLRELDAVDRERDQYRASRDDVAARLAALPAPQRGLLGRAKDPHAAERARLTAALDGAERQLVALERQRDQLTSATPGLDAARRQRDTLAERETQLRRDAHELRDELAERDVITPPRWARETFGDRPGDRRQARQWDRAVRAVARYRLEHDLPDTVLGLGPEPADQRGRGAWQRTATTVEETQRRLGRAVARDRDPGLEL